MPGPAISWVLENIDFCSRMSRKYETDMISKPEIPGIFSVDDGSHGGTSMSSDFSVNLYNILYELVHKGFDVFFTVW